MELSFTCFLMIIILHIFKKNTENLKAIFWIENGNLLNGDFPVSKLKLVQSWAEIHKDELLTMWNTKEFHKINPLQ